MAEQAGRLAYAHGSTFTTEPLEAYAREVAVHLPIDDPAIYPVSGGSEAIETALKLARAYHLARGEPERLIVYARWGSYHGNTLGALDLSGRKPLRRPYEGWLGRFRHVSAAYPYRAGLPGANALGSADDLAAELDRTFEAAGPGTVAAFVAEPIVGRDPGRGRPARRLLAGHRGRLPPARRAADRGRGHDRLRANRALVRARSLGRPAGHPRGGQGGVVGLLAVRVRRRLGCRVRGRHRRHRLHPWVHLLARPGRGGRRARGPAHPRTRVARRGQRREGGAAPFAGHRRVRRSPRRRRDPRARPAGRDRAGGRSRHARAVPAGRAGHRGGRPGRPRVEACWSTPGPATPTASTATRSCSGRRSWSPTPSSSGSPRRWRPRSRQPRRPRHRSPAASDRGQAGAQPPGTHPAIVRSAGRWHRAGSTRDRARRGAPAGSARRARRWRCSRRRSARAGHRTRAASRTRRPSRHAPRR